MTAQHNAALISKPQEVIALQRRTISGPNGEIIRPPGPPQPPVTPTNDLKMPFTAKSSLPLQHRPGPFYGHNPNLKCKEIITPGFSGKQMILKFIMSTIQW